MSEKKKEDKIEQISREANIKNLKREQEQYTKNIEFHNELLKKLDNEEKLVMERYELMFNNFEVINPVWKYETSARFIEIQREELKLKKEQDINLFQRNRDMIEKTIKNQNEQLKSVSTELKRLKGE